jgi:hypothetical protein
MQASENLFLGLRQIYIGEELPSRNRSIPDPWCFNLAKPSHEMRQCHARYSVCQKKINVLLTRYFSKNLLDRHNFFIEKSYKGGVRRI